MSSPQRQYYRQTSPTWLERNPWLEWTVEALFKLIVLTSPFGAGFVSGLDLPGVWTGQASAAVGSAFADLMALLYSLVLLVWVVAVVVWLGSHLLRPHSPIRFEQMGYALTSLSWFLYLIAFVQAIGG